MIAAQQSQAMAQQVALRPARESDADLLLAWVNQSDSLAAKLKTTTPIPRETHIAWLRKRLVSPECAIWVAERVGAPVGQMRAERGEDGLEVDIFVAPEARGNGIALAMLGMLAVRCAERWPGAPLIARIKPDNLASRRLFVRAGYAEAGPAPDHLVFRKVALS
jgi:RimJ/RimL family protein N-acetyltransferase